MSARAGAATHTRSASGRAKPTARAALLVAVVMVLGLAFVYPARQYLGERAQIADLQRQAHALEVQNTVLEHQVTELHDPAYLERLARECLGMIKPGDIAFVSVPKGSDTGSSEC
ncbi:MAG: septum formation initiator family protein [Actinomycetota bacterium]|nr:septum formation initiator family protein [Actinomycetota bacterium]